MLPHIKDSKNFWTVVVDNKSYTFDPSHPEYMALVECVKVGDPHSFVETIDRGTVIENWSEGSFRFLDGYLYYEDEQISNQITSRIVEMIKNGFDYKPMLNFLERLYSNVSNRAIVEFYNWIAHKHLPITPDGYILGYKAVAVYNGEDSVDKMGNKLTKGDLVDKYSGNSYRNNVGDSPAMKRWKVDDNCNNGCSNGLHVGTIQYVQSYGGVGDKVVICMIDPADIVSIPSDSECQKVRCTGYRVVALYDGNLLPDHVDDSYYDDECDNCDECECCDNDYEDWSVENN